jgi:hypothetical protein
MTEGTVVSVNKARRILGELADDIPDDQMREIIHALHLLAREQLVYNGSKDDKYSEELPRSANNS